MPTGTGLPLCHEYICRGGSCQEHRGIMFLMAIPVALCLRNSGSQTPDCWLKLGRNTQLSQGISITEIILSVVDISWLFFCQNTLRQSSKLIDRQTNVRYNDCIATLGSSYGTVQRKIG